MSRTLKALLPQWLVDLGHRLGVGRTKSVKRRQLPTAQYEALSALKCCVWYNEYGGYCLPESSLHRSAPRRVLRAEVYEPQTIAFMRDNCAPGDVVHAGTYFGDFLPGLSRACSAGAKIWAFEPNPENFQCAQITILINKLQNVTLRNAGLGEEDTVLRLRTRDENGRALGGKSRIVHDSEFDTATDEEVHIVSIDKVVDQSRPVSIIQLDVEDHEKAALTGALKTIHRCLPIIILEVRRGSNLLESDWFSENILSLGYQQTRTLHGNTVFEHSN